MKELSTTLFAKVKGEWLKIAKYADEFITVYKDGEEITIDKDDVEGIETDIG